MAGANTLTFDESNFETEVLQSDQPVLVDFWAEWCGPCRLVAPTIDELANAYQGKVKVGKVDIDANPSLATRFGIQSIPTVVVFADGEAVEKIVGAKHKRDYQSILDAQLGRSGSPG